MGYFITIDGQHGVGKSYLAEILKERLSAKNYSVAVTHEPTNTEIGILARSSEQVCAGKPLACLFAADRHQHCELIKELLLLHDIVLCDRYLISSLILQNMDGVDFHFIMNLNNGVLSPNLQIVLYAEDSIIRDRLANKSLSRFAQQERVEKYDRFQFFKDELKNLVGDIQYMFNNSVHDIDLIFNYILQRLSN